jgi:hypothetical protein
LESKIIETIALDNGLVLEIKDYSRKVAADRWLVKLVALMQIAVTDKGFSDRLPQPAPLDQLRDKLGDCIYHEYQVERNFVDAVNKESVLEHMLDGILTKQTYYSHPDFGARCIIKEYVNRRKLPPSSE